MRGSVASGAGARVRSGGGRGPDFGSVDSRTGRPGILDLVATEGQAGPSYTEGRAPLGVAVVFPLVAGRKASFTWPL